MYLIGQANDTHELVDMRDGVIVLGGYKFITNYRVLSHSDGDVVLHTIANAILGSVQMGDIGEHFSDTDKKNKWMSSIKIIQFALKELFKKKYKIVNLDLTITCENIILGSKKKQIQASLSKILKTKLINVKATRFEHPSNLIKCAAVILVNK
ncbi:2-C-methyl-D-erythritol 2,4-cyclodiphosphate synthase [Bacilli bacterium]|nr:2-C-methyl-D-erythritol 2,4-cyclodiphosphate synthase [Bacilli bacterium]